MAEDERRFIRGTRRVIRGWEKHSAIWPATDRCMAVDVFDDGMSDIFRLLDRLKEVKTLSQEGYGQLERYRDEARERLKKLDEECRREKP